MARITVEDCLTRENNRFALVQLASKRTKQLLSGSRTLTTESKGNKAVVTALREIAQGAVRFMTPEDEAKIREREERMKELGIDPTPSPVAAADDLFLLPTIGLKENGTKHLSPEEKELLGEDDEEIEEDLDDADADDEGDDDDDDGESSPPSSENLNN